MSLPIATTQFITPIEMRRCIWRIVPLTLALCLGPTLDGLYFLGLAMRQVGGIVSPFQAINGLLLVAMFLALPGNRIALLTQRSVLRPIFLLAIYALIMGIISPYPRENLVDGLQLLFLYLVFISTMEFSRRGRLSQAWYSIVPWVILGLMILSQVLGMYLGVKGRGAYDLAAVGIAGRPNSIGGFAVSVLPWFLALASNGIVNVFGAFMAFGVAVASMRRNAFVVTSTTLVIMVMYLILRTRKFGHKLMLIGLSGVLCFVFAAFLLYTPMGEGFIHRLEDLNVFEGGTGGGRTQFMMVAWEHLLSRGVVASVFGEGSGAIADIIEAGWGARIGAHNGWLDITTAFGVVGLILLIWFHLNVVRLALLSEDTKRTAAFGAVVVVWIGGLIMDGIYGPSSCPIYALLGILTGSLPQYYVFDSRYNTIECWSLRDPALTLE